MDAPSGSLKAFNPRSWYRCFVLFLAFLVPIAPLLAEIQESAATRASYASSYSDCYEDVAKAIHVKWAWYGFGTLVLGAVLAFLIIALANRGS